MYRRRYWPLAFLLLAAPAAGQSYSAVLDWQHDGVDVASFRAYAGRSSTSLSQISQVFDPAARMMSVDGLAGGVWYFALTAVGPTAAESAFSNIACVALGSGTCPSTVPVSVPGAVSNLVVTPVAISTAAVTVTMLLGSAADQFNVIVTGTGLVRLQLMPSGTTFDYLKVAGGSSADIPGVTPALGGNNDRPTPIGSNVITFTAPINGWTDIDGPSLTGVSATVGGVTKPLIRVGTDWSVAFP